MITDILKRSNLHKQFNATNICYQISLMKNSALDESNDRCFTNPLIHEIYKVYEKEKNISACFDFDDLLVHTVALFKKNETFRKDFQKIVRHILVDEYQDTNRIQHLLLKLMALDTKNNLAIDSLCAVGDEDQSIYSWRGAHVTNMLTFYKDFPHTTTIKVEQNYRSVQPILAVANSIIANNTQRSPKTLWSAHKAKDRIRLLSCSSEYQEAEAIANLAVMVRKYIADKQIAVLYRTHAQSRMIEELLIKHSIPYKIIGGIQFYERKEIKDLLAFMRLVANPYDRISLFRVLNVPSRGLGEKFEEQVRTLWNLEPFSSFHDILRTILNNPDTSASKVKALNNFLAIFYTLTPESSAVTVLEQIIHNSQYQSYIRESYEKEDAQERLENIKELIEAAIHFEKEGITTTTLFLDEVALLQEKKSENEDLTQKYVLLMTLHAAKGLEFDIVVLPGLEEHMIPSSRSLDNDEALQEERRLLYVGITRAREYLLLLHAQLRSFYGKTNSTIPSRFLDELSREHIKEEQCSFWKSTRFEDYFKQWFSILETSSRNNVLTFGQHLQSSFENKIGYPQKTTNTQKKEEYEGFKPMQPVKHQKYGLGIVQNQEYRSDGSLSVTVHFKDGVKKILARFLEKQ